jgi:nitroreductase
MDPQKMMGLLKAHASCRVYDATPLEDGLLERMIEAAQQTSTDATGQLYSVIRVSERQLRQDVAALAGDQDHIREAAEFLVVCLDVRRLRRLLEHRGRTYGMRSSVSLLFGITDAALFAQSLALAAEAHGLGVCFIGGVQNHAFQISQALAIPSGVVPLWGLTIGVPSAAGRPKPRLPLDLVLHTDRYRDASDGELAAAFDAMAAATRSGDWVNPLGKYFAADGVMASREADFRRLLELHGLSLGDV